MKARILNICQYEKNPRTGEDLHFGEQNIQAALAHKSFKRWAYILHDKDVYTDQEEAACIESLGKEYDTKKPADISKEDYIKREQWVRAGDKKPRHWHIAIQSDRAQDLSVVAAWLGIKEQYIDVPKGRGAFLDCVEYETHEDDKQQAAGKHLYDDTEVHANFDWRAELDHRAEIQEKYHRDTLTPKEQMRMDVLLNGKTLAQCQQEDPLGYADDMDKLAKLRARYLATQQMPPVRINYYIEGRGGVGKGTLSRLLAKSLFPGRPDSEVYFEVGGSGVALDGYDGQPVIIWHDRRAASLLKELGGRGNVFNVFDTHPAAIKQNVKYSSASLVNAVNIINGIEPYQDFLDGLAGEYTDRSGEDHKAEDKGQSYRRFPLIICLHEHDFDCLVNKGFAEGTFEFEQYIQYKHIVGNFGEVMRKLDGKARNKVVIDMTKPIVDEHHKLETAAEHKALDDTAIPEEFKDYGRDADEVEAEKKAKEQAEQDKEWLDSLKPIDDDEELPFT